MEHRQEQQVDQPLVGIRRPKAPWEYWDEEMDVDVSPQLQEEIDAYSRRHHEVYSSQNAEELHRQRELNDGWVKDYLWKDQEDWMVPDEDRMGRVLHSSELINLFREEFNPRFWYGTPSVAIVKGQKVYTGLIDLIAQPHEFIKPMFLSGVQLGFMPEYSVMRFDSHKVPLNEKFRGWRTVLLRLIMQGCVSEERAHEVFGEAEGQASRRYRETLFNWRSGK